MSGRPPLEIALLVLLATLWAGSYSFIAVAVATIPPVTLIAARTLIAGGVLAAILPLRGLALPRDRAMWGRCAVQAALNSVAPFLLIAWGQQSVPASLAVILSSTAPIFAFLAGVALARRRRGGGSSEGFGPRKGLGVVVGLLGVGLILGREALAGPSGGMLPMLALLAAGACFGIGAHVAQGFAGTDPMVPAAGSLLCGAAVLVPASLALERPWALSPSLDSVLALLGLSLLSTALAVLIYFRLLRTLGVVGTTAQSYLRVPIGTALGVLLLGETMTGAAWIGLALVMAGVAAMALPERGPPVAQRG